MRTETRKRRQEREVIRWRREQLRAAGFPPRTAVLAASDQRYDLHALIGLVEHGCPPALAVRILAPLDEEPSA